MEVRLALSITRNRGDPSDGYGQPYAQSNEEYDPRIEWREGPCSYILVAYVPGFKRENVRVEVDDTRTMTISGERRFEEMVMVGWTWHRMERRGQSFRKQVRIPENVNMDAITGRFESGILYIIMPKFRPSIETRDRGISDYSMEKPPEPDAPSSNTGPDVESSDTETPTGIRIEDVSLQPEEAPPSDADDPSRRVLEIPEVLEPSSDESPGRGTSEVQVPYEVEYPEEEVNPPIVPIDRPIEEPISMPEPQDRDEDITAPPPELAETADAPLDIQSSNEAVDNEEENMPTIDPGIPPPSAGDQTQEYPLCSVASTPPQTPTPSPPRTPKEQQSPAQLQSHPPQTPPGTPPQTPEDQQPPPELQHHPPETPQGQQPPAQLQHHPPETPKEQQPPTQLPPQTPPGTPPQTPKDQQSPAQLQRHPEQEPHGLDEHEPSPPQMVPISVKPPNEAEELEKIVEDLGADLTKKEDASPDESVSESNAEQPDRPDQEVMQQPIQPVDEDTKNEEKQRKIEEVFPTMAKELEDGEGLEDEEPSPSKDRSSCKMYAMLSFLLVAVVAFVAHEVRCKR